MSRRSPTPIGGRSTPQMSRQGSLRRIIKDLEAGIVSPYDGIMYPYGKPLEGNWITGIRAPDARVLLQALRDAGITG